MLLRWTFTVVSVTPISLAIWLFSRIGFEKIGNRCEQPRLQAYRPQQSSKRFAKLRIIV